VRVGLRPCDIHVVGKHANGSGMRGRVVLAERLGRNIELTIDLSGTQLIVLTSGREGVEEGEDVVMTVADADVHVFGTGEGDTPRLGPVDRESTLEAAQ
jgi:multiple sugar transport system ATP-binding protein